MQYAYFNPNQGGLILGWLDTATHACVLPDASMLHECTAAEWAMQGQQEQLAVVNGVVVAYTPPDPSIQQAAQAKAQLQAQARELLAQSDVQVIRAYESGQPVPATWKAYRDVLRVIVSTGTGTIPATPALPTGA